MGPVDGRVARLAEMAVQAAACVACPLATAGRSAPVFGAAVPCRMVVCGEAPGAAEDRQGVPFVGRSGLLLRSAIADAGVDVQVGFVNTVMCRPPANRTPTSGEVAACRRWLFEHLALLAPEVVVTVGLAASRAVGVVAPGGRLSDSFGSVTQVTLGGVDIKVVTAWHPAAVLRARSRYPQLVAQLASAAELLH